MAEGKKKARILACAAVLTVVLTGCSTDVSQDAAQSGIENGETAAETQLAASQDETAAEGAQTILIDELLDDNLSIHAELTMPTDTLYEYSTVLKEFDYENALEIISPSGEGTIGGETGSLVYRKNDMASHLDTYCTYAAEQGLAADGELSFLSQADAIIKSQKLMEELNVGGELGTPEVVAMTGEDFRNAQKAILEDATYQKIMSSKGYDSDSFDESLEVYQLTFQMEENEIPIYRNVPYLQQTTDRLAAYPVTVKILLSNSGIEMVSLTGMLEPYAEQREEAAIIGGGGIKDAILKKFGDVILPTEYNAVNIWMEYFPLLREDSFTEADLVPVWCVDFEIGGESVGDSAYTLRFNAVTGEEIS